MRVVPVIIDQPWEWGKSPAAPLIINLNRGLMALYNNCNPLDASVILLITCDSNLKRRARRVMKYIEKFRECGYEGVFFIGVYGSEAEMPMLAQRYLRKDVTRIFIEPTFDQIHRDATSSHAIPR